jgi:alpha-mannosidase
LRLKAVNAFNSGAQRKLYVPLTVWNTNPSAQTVPVEVECMIGLRPAWTGDWHLRLYSLDGREIPCQEEQPESLMPFNWRKRIAFMASLPQVGVSRYELRILKGRKGDNENRRVPSLLKHVMDPRKGLITSLDAGEGRECLSGPLLQPIVIEDGADSWGAGRWRYRDVGGIFQPNPDKHVVVESGPVRTIVQSVFHYAHSSIEMRTISYASWPVLEYQLRIKWGESAKRLKLSIPTRFRNENIYCEVPGGAVTRPSDGDEHVHGRWCMLDGSMNGKRTGFAVVNSGQHGFDFRDGEIRLSVLRSAAYCHDQGLRLSGPVARKYMDQGIHEVRLLVVAGDADEVLKSLPGLADWLSASPAVYTHLPVGLKVNQTEEILQLEPANVRLLATKQSEDGKSLILRFQETVGSESKAILRMGLRKTGLPLAFKPFEIKTIRLEKSGRCREVGLISER